MRAIHAFRTVVPIGNFCFPVVCFFDNGQVTPTVKSGGSRVFAAPQQLPLDYFSLPWYLFFDCVPVTQEIGTQGTLVLIVTEIVANYGHAKLHSFLHGRCNLCLLVSSLIFLFTNSLRPTYPQVSYSLKEHHVPQEKSCASEPRTHVPSGSFSSRGLIWRRDLLSSLCVGYHGRQPSERHADLVSCIDTGAQRRM
jgi:hypothetical protein